jgi:serine phosphatase RsbU (regulator of sigma subunit)
MSVVQASLRAIASQADGPLSQLAEKMNSFLYASSDSNKYATFFYAQLECDGKRLRYVNAGHNPPFIVRRANGAVDIEELTIGGSVIGLLPNMRYEDAVIDLASGDVFVAYTDGVTEALNAAGEEFGEARLKQYLKAFAGARADEIASKLSDVLTAWIGEAEQHDDMTLVVAMINGAPATVDV